MSVGACCKYGPCLSIVMHHATDSPTIRPPHPTLIQEGLSCPSSCVFTLRGEVWSPWKHHALTHASPLPLPSIGQQWVSSTHIALLHRTMWCLMHTFVHTGRPSLLKPEQQFLPWMRIYYFAPRSYRVEGLTCLDVGQFRCDVWCNGVSCWYVISNVLLVWN